MVVISLVHHGYVLCQLSFQCIIFSKPLIVSVCNIRAKWSRIQSKEISNCDGQPDLKAKHMVIEKSRKLLCSRFVTFSGTNSNGTNSNYYYDVTEVLLQIFLCKGNLPNTLKGLHMTVFYFSKIFNFSYLMASLVLNINPACLSQ